MCRSFRKKRRSDLSVPAQQPHGNDPHQGSASGVGDYANRVGAVILYDAAYEAYITEPDVPHSIFELPGARTCAIEFRSFSKKAGFTGCA